MNIYKNINIGVLALQGDYERHLNQISLIGARGKEIKLPEQLKTIDSLIIPGGESTTMNILLDRFNLREPLTEFVCSKPVWGTCAGMIMLAKNVVDNQANIKSLGAIDIDVIRNGYGRQIFSFETELKTKLFENGNKLIVSFIRAPKVVRVGEKVTKLADFKNSSVLVKEDNVLASSFHSELENNTKLLEYFLQKFLLD